MIYLIVGIVIGIVVALLIVLLYDFTQRKKFKLDSKFRSAQLDVANSLKEKKNAREKEMTKEIEQFLETKKALAAQNIENLEKSFSEKSKSLENQYEKMESDLKENYEEKRKAFIRMEQTDQQDRMERNSQLVAKAQATLDAQLKELNENYED